jgi:hypothetical protein
VVVESDDGGTSTSTSTSASTSAGSSAGAGVRDSSTAHAHEDAHEHGGVVEGFSMKEEELPVGEVIEIGEADLGAPGQDVAGMPGIPGAADPAWPDERSIDPQAPPDAGISLQFDIPLPESMAEAAAAAGAASGAADETVAPGDIRTDPGDTPSFVRRAERAARWQRPWVRAVLGVACLLAAALLAGQWLLAQRDLMAARSPALKPWLTGACAALGCEVKAPRALDGLRVESSGIARVDKTDYYRLSVALRNLRAHEVALPAIELALTDTQGRLIARRVVRAGELGARAGSLASGAELMLQGTLRVESGLVAGYTIELFYP